MEHSDMTDSIVYPEMREEAISSLGSLADRAHQEARWGVFHPEAGYYDDFTMNVHTLYDDCCVLPDPTAAVGTILRESEVEPLRRLAGPLGELLDELGESPDDAYTSHPKWPLVVAAAQAALDAMQSA
jgi:hypothetical protein